MIIKNLPTINQENFRRDVNINVSSRAFGEIYLRSFSVCQFTGQPAGVLSSTNSINGEPACSQRGLNTDIIRNDWGFKGFVMSDWGSDTEKSYDLHAGCDLIMPGYNPDKILESMMETAPTFEEDGYVSVVETAYLYDIPMIRYENWGSFMLDKDGKDTVVAKVPADIEISEKALKAEKEGLCKIETEMDGTKMFTYIDLTKLPVENFDVAGLTITNPLTKLEGLVIKSERIGEFEFRLIGKDKSQSLLRSLLAK